MNDTYDSDLYLWTKAQGDALRRRAANEIDWDNVAEEIESLGVSQRHEIRSRLEVLLIHLLKHRYDPDHRSPSWIASISEQRRRIDLVLEDSPSLRTFPAAALAKAYQLALLDKATDPIKWLSLPAECPWTIERVLDPEWLPE